MQAAVEPRGGAGRRHQVAVVDVQHVGVEPHARKAPREVVRPRPVRGRRAIVAPAGAPIFAPGSDGVELHPVVASRPYAHRFEKSLASAFAGTDLAAWLDAHGIDTLAVAGYMTHNCNASTVYHAAHAGLNVEYLEDATGAVPYENAAGAASAEEIHRAYTVVFQSNFAAVMSTDAWIAGLAGGAMPARESVSASNRRARARRAQAA
ncbi:isochorismatase family protein [Burkholderia ubonensis]|uniref:isochorismatase family protein n=1 Tax=Burkholderia ubonensis TaxID=101571 RepID=UPI0039F494E8